MRMSRWWRPAAVLVFALTLAAPLLLLRADDKPDGPMDKKAVDAMLFKTLREVINRGADVYKTGDHAGCYHIYEGALIATKPLLDHRPELQKAIDKAFEDAGRQDVMWRRAFTLRGTIDKIREDTNPMPKPPADKPPADKPSPPLPDKPPADKPPPDKPPVDKDKPPADKPPLDKDKPVDKDKKPTDKPPPDKPPADKPPLDKDKPALDKDKPALDKPALDKDKPADKPPLDKDKPADKPPPASDKPSDKDKPADKPSDKDAKPTDKDKPGDKPNDKDAKPPVDKDKPIDKDKGAEKPLEKGTVTGTVTFQGKPLPGGIVTFVNADKMESVGILKEDGTYSITAIKPGAYKVTIDTEGLKDDEKLAKLYVAIPKKYSDAGTSGLTIEVKAGASELNIEMK